MSDETWIAINT